MSVDANVAAEHRHRVINVIAAILANAQYLETTFQGSSANEPLLAKADPAVRRDALTALRNIVESTHALAEMIAPR